MSRILFLLLWLIPVLGLPAYGDIEIYANGHKYDSLQTYEASQKIVVVPPSSTPVALNSQQEDEIKKEARKLGVDVETDKIKTLQINKKMSDKALHKLYVLSVEKGVAVALQDFYQTRALSSFPLSGRNSSRQLQEAIQEAVTMSKAPKLLVSEPGKVRIMALTVDDSGMKTNRQN